MSSSGRASASGRIDKKRRIMRLWDHLNREEVQLWLNNPLFLRGIFRRMSGTIALISAWQNTLF